MAIKFYNVSSNTDSTKHSKSLIFTHTDEDIIINLPNHSGTLATSNGLEEAYRARYGTNNLTFILTPAMATRDTTSKNFIVLLPGEFKTSASFLGKHDTTIWEVYKNNSITEANKVATEDNPLYKDRYTLPTLPDTGSNYLVRYKFRSNNIESSWSPAYSFLPLSSGLLPITASASENSLIPDITISEVKGYGNAASAVHTSTEVAVYNADYGIPRGLVGGVTIRPPKDLRNFKLTKSTGEVLLKPNKRYIVRIKCITNNSDFDSIETTINIVTPVVFISKPEVTYLQRSTDRAPIDFMDSRKHGLDRDPVVKVQDGRGGTDEYRTAYAYGYDASIGWPRYIFTIDRDPITTGIDLDKVRNFYLKYKLYVIYKGQKIEFRAENNFGIADQDGWNMGYNLKAMLRRYGGDNSDATMEKLGYKLITYKGKKLTAISIPPYAVLDKLASLTGINREDINLTKFKFQIAFRYDIDNNYSDVVFEELKLSYAKTDIYYFTILDRLDEKKFPAIVTSGISLLDYDPAIGTYGPWETARDAKYVFTFYNKNGEYSTVVNAFYHGSPEAGNFFSKNGVNYKLADAMTKYFKENIKPFIPTIEFGGYDAGRLVYLANISDEQWKEISKLFTPDADTVTVDSYAIVKEQYTSLYRTTLKADMLPSLYKGNVISRFNVIPDKRFDHLDDVYLMVKPYDLVKYNGTQVNITKVEIFVTNNGPIDGRPKNIRLRYFSLESSSYGLITSTGALYANKKDDSIFGKLNIEYGDVLTLEVVMNTEFGIIEQSAKDTARMDRWTIEDAESWFKTVGGKQSLCVVPTRILFQPEDREIDGKREFRIDVNDIAQHGCSDLPGSTILDYLHIEVFKKPDLNTPVIRADLKLKYNDKFQWTTTDYGWYNKCLFVADRDKEKLKDRITFGSSDSMVMFYTNSNYIRGTYVAGDKSDIKFKPGDELIIKMNMQEYPEEELLFRGGKILKSYTYIRAIRVPEIVEEYLSQPKFVNVSNNPIYEHSGLAVQFFNHQQYMGSPVDYYNGKFLLNKDAYVSRGYDNNIHVETIWEFRDTHGHYVKISKKAPTDDLYSLPMRDAFIWYGDEGSGISNKCLLHPNGKYFVQVTYVNGSGAKSYASGSETDIMGFDTAYDFTVAPKVLLVDPSNGPTVIEIDRYRDTYRFQDYIKCEMEITTNNDINDLPKDVPTLARIKHVTGVKPVFKGKRHTDTDLPTVDIFPMNIIVCGRYKYSASGNGNDLVDVEYPVVNFKLERSVGKIVATRRVTDISHGTMKINNANSNNIRDYWAATSDGTVYIKKLLNDYLRANSVDMVGTTTVASVTEEVFGDNTSLNFSWLDMKVTRKENGKVILTITAKLHDTWSVGNAGTPEPFYMKQNVFAIYGLDIPAYGTAVWSDKRYGQVFTGLHFDKAKEFIVNGTTYQADAIMADSFFNSDHKGLRSTLKTTRNSYTNNLNAGMYYSAMKLINHGESGDLVTLNSFQDGNEITIPYISPNIENLYIAVNMDSFCNYTGSGYKADERTKNQVFDYGHKVDIYKLTKNTTGSIDYNVDIDIVPNTVGTVINSTVRTSDLYRLYPITKPVTDSNTGLNYFRVETNGYTDKKILEPGELYCVIAKLTPLKGIFFSEAIQAIQTFKVYNEATDKPHVPAVAGASRLDNYTYLNWFTTNVDSNTNTKVPFIEFEGTSSKSVNITLNYKQGFISLNVPMAVATELPDFTITKLKVGPHDLTKDGPIKPTDITYTGNNKQGRYENPILRQIAEDNSVDLNSYSITLDDRDKLNLSELPLGMTVNAFKNTKLNRFKISTAGAANNNFKVVVKAMKVEDMSLESFTEANNKPFIETKVKVIGECNISFDFKEGKIKTAYMTYSPYTGGDVISGYYSIDYVKFRGKDLGISKTGEPDASDGYVEEAVLDMASVKLDSAMETDLLSNYEFITKFTVVEIHREDNNPVYSASEDTYSFDHKALAVMSSITDENAVQDPAHAANFAKTIVGKVYLKKKGSTSGTTEVYSPL